VSFADFLTSHERGRALPALPDSRASIWPMHWRLNRPDAERRPCCLPERRSVRIRDDAALQPTGAMSPRRAGARLPADALTPDVIRTLSVRAMRYPPGADRHGCQRHRACAADFALQSAPAHGVGWVRRSPRPCIDPSFDPFQSSPAWWRPAPSWDVVLSPGRDAESPATHSLKGSDLTMTMSRMDTMMKPNLVERVPAGPTGWACCSEP